MPTMALESRSRTHQRGRAAYPRLRERGAEGVLRTIRGAGAEDRCFALTEQTTESHAWCFRR